MKSFTLKIPHVCIYIFDSALSTHQYFKPTKNNLLYPHLSSELTALKAKAYTSIIKPEATRNALLNDLLPQLPQVQFQLTMSCINLSLLAVILLICEIHAAITTAHPLGSLAKVDTNSVSLQERSSDFDIVSKTSIFTRELAKRDVGIAHWILIIVILAFGVVFMYYWKCVRPRKMAEKALQNIEEGDQNSGGSKAGKALNIVKMFL